MICVLSSCASNVAGHTKKVTVNAMYLIGYCVGNLIGPQTFIEEQAPDYSGAKVAMVVTSCGGVAILITIWVVMASENKKKDAKANEYRDFEKNENYEFADLTDKENPLFRYTL
ncbi:Allantoate permease [Candidozyma auris]